MILIIRVNGVYKPPTNITGSHIVGHHFPCILHLKYQVSEPTMSFGSFEIWAQKNNDPAAPLLVKMVEHELQ